jgi:ribosomal protein L35
MLNFMGKMKTHKAITKRFDVKKSKKGVKVLKRVTGQGHFNGRETGKVRRNKRRDLTMSATLQQTIINAFSN